MKKIKQFHEEQGTANLMVKISLMVEREGGVQE